MILRLISSAGQGVCLRSHAARPLAKGKIAPAKKGLGIRWMAGALMLALALLLSACATQEGTEALPSGETGATAEATESPAAQAASDATEPDAPASAASSAFTDIEDAPAARITDIRLGKHPHFERLVIDFATEQGDANGVPHWRIEKAPGEGVVRIHLPTVTETAFTDAQLVDKFDWFTHVYVVRAPDGSLFVDVFIPAEYQVRLQELWDPLRLVVDVAPGGKETHILPATAKNMVLITPRPGATLQGTVTVSGYSRNFEANNVIILKDSAGKEIDRALVNSTDYVETWGFFSKEIAIPAGTGTGTLQVGDFDAQDGKFDGVTIPVQFGGQ